MAIGFGLLSVHMARSRIGKAVLLLLTLGLLIASGSKGGIMTLFICVIILCLLKWHSKWYQVAGALLVLLPIGVVLIWLVPTLFPENTLSVYSSVPTRLAMVLCALITVVHHPFGVGLPGFLPAVAKYAPGAMSGLESFFDVPLNFTEVTGFMTSAEGVSTKTFFFDQLIRFGVPFAFFFFAFITGLLKRLAEKKLTILLIATLACTIAILTYHPGTGNFAIAIVFGVALSEVGFGSNPRRCD
jgi:hypothetical protein